MNDGRDSPHDSAAQDDPCRMGKHLVIGQRVGGERHDIGGCAVLDQPHPEERSRPSGGRSDCVLSR